MIANIAVSALVVTAVKIGRDIVLGIGQVIENGPVVGLECPGFEMGPQALGLRVVIVLAASAVRELGLGRTWHGISQQSFVSVTFALHPAVGVDKQGRGRPLGYQRPLQGAGDQDFVHIARTRQLTTSLVDMS